MILDYYFGRAPAFIADSPQLRLVSSLVSDKSKLHIRLSNFRLGQGHGRVSQLCVTRGHVALSCVPWCENEIKVSLLHTASHMGVWLAVW
ncbi:DNA ligase [Gossypium arboreum]|uniref:DNA ligase n=1 Tax=Gossypium arboreum TaxID=29729 RepID=A0A0B0PP14_GOSAR|nr:DNA ligase [Gossypium arboreum]